MDHDIAALLADLVAGVIPAHPSQGAMGDCVVPLTAPPGRAATGPMELNEASGASVVEESVPAPGRVTIANGSGREVVAYAGTVLRGGFAGRALMRTAVVAAGARRVVTVEPLEPRWWPTGPLRPAGTVDPVRATLLELCDRRGVLAARARTALWSLHRDPDEVREWPVPHDGGTRGWIVVIDGQIAGAYVRPPHLPRPDVGTTSSTGTVGAPGSEPGTVMDLAATFLGRLLTDVHWARRSGAVVEGMLDDSAIRLTPLSGFGAHLTAVRLADDLVTATVAMGRAAPPAPGTARRISPRR